MMRKYLPMILAGALWFGAPSAGMAEPGGSLFERLYVGTGKAEVWQAVMASLAANDLPVVGADFERGKIRARQHNYLNAQWASCYDGSHRSFDPTHPTNLNVRSAPLYRGVDIRLEITETTKGTRLALNPHYYDVDRDSQHREFAFQVPCRSTGVLEQVLFDAPDSAG